MASRIKKFVAEQTKAVAATAEKLRTQPVAAARGAAATSAGRVKSLRDPVRTVARSGVKLSNVSEAAVQQLIALQSEIVTAALSEAAGRLEKAARSESVGDLVRSQSDVLQSARDRIVGDMGRAVSIFTDAARSVRALAGDTIEQLRKPAAAPARARAKAKVKRKVRAAAKKGARRGRKTAR